MDCWSPGFSVHGILQAWILEWVAIPSSRESFQPRDRTWVSCISGRFFTLWVTKEARLPMRYLFIQFCGQPWNRISCFRNVSARSLSTVRAEKEIHTMFDWKLQKRQYVFRNVCTMAYSFGLLTPSLQLHSWKCFSISLHKITSGQQRAGKRAQGIRHTSTELTNTSKNHTVPQLLIWFIIKSFTCLKALSIKAALKLKLRTKECL